MPDGDCAVERLLCPTLALEHRHWSEVRDKLVRAQRTGCRCVAVLGPPGTGKTLLLRDFGSALARETTTPVRNVAASGSPAIVVVAVGPSGTALIDDADKLSDSVLAALTAPGGPQCVLAGPNAFALRLTRLVKDLEIVGMAPLPPNEASVYLAMWLMRGGLPPTRFEPAAATALVEAASGIPRTLNELAGRAEWFAVEERARRVAARHVRAATLSLLDTAALPLPTASTAGAWRRLRDRIVESGTVAGSRALRLGRRAIGVRPIDATSQPGTTAVPAAFRGDVA